MEAGDPRAAKVYESIGCYLGHTLAYYYEKYGFRQISGEFLKDDIPHVQMELWFR